MNIGKEHGATLSVVVAAYNAEKYLDTCLRALVSQTIFPMMEVVVVNDGSEDETAAIAAHYTRANKNVHLIDLQKNGGAGCAKNIGVRSCVGKYIGFCDADDWLPSDYFEQLYLAATEHDADLSCGDLALHYDDGRVVLDTLLQSNMLFRKMMPDLEPDGKTPFVLPKQAMAAHWGAAAAGTKLFAADLIRRFPFFEGRSDDIPAILPAIACAERAVYVPGAVYAYRQHQGTLERSGFSEGRLGVVDAMMLAAERMLSCRDGEEHIRIMAGYNLFGFTMGLLYSVDPEDRMPMYSLLYEKLRGDRTGLLLDLVDNQYVHHAISHYSEAMRTEIEAVFVSLRAGDIEEMTRLSLSLNRITSAETEAIEHAAHRTPLVSIVIPVYNGSDFLAQAITSALNQTYQKIEVIVVNDGSTDGGKTEAIARSFGDSIRYFSKENGGVASALNMGIQNMQGDYFSWLSHDDMYTPEKITHEIGLMRQQDDIRTIIAEGYQVVNEAGTYMYTVNLHNQEQHKKESLKNSLYVLLRGGINGCGMLIHRSHFDRVGLFNESLPTTQDYELFFRMFRGQKIVYSEESNVLSRVHENQGSKAMYDGHVKECDALWIGIMEELSDLERSQIDGSPFAFFAKIHDFLQGATGYTGAILHAKKRAIQEAEKEYRLSKSEQMLSEMACLCGYDAEYLKKHVLPIGENQTDKPRLVFALGDRHEAGGLNRVVLQVAALLSDVYDVFTTTAVNSGEQYAYPNPPNTTELYLPLTNHLTQIFGLICVLIHADILVVSYNCSPVWFELHRQARYLGLSSIAWNHESYFLPYWRPELRSGASLRNEFLASASATLWLSPSSATIYGMHEKNGVYLPNPAPDDSFLPTKKRKKAAGNVLLAVGRFDDRVKGLENLLRMFANVVKSVEAAHLYIVGSYNLDLTLGEGSRMTYRTLIQRLSIPADHIHFEGWVDRIESYYERATINILPSVHEGFGLVILEAAAYGVPSMVFEGSGASDIITHGVDGVAVEKGNADMLAQYAIDLLSDSAYRAKLSAGSRRMLEKYAPQRIKDMWVCLVDSVLREERAYAAESFLKEYPVPDVDTRALLKYSVREYESFIRQMTVGSPIVVHQDVPVVNAEVPVTQAFDVVITPPPSFLRNSHSWRITRPIRAFQQARRRPGGLVVKAKYYKIYMKDPTIEKHTNAEIIVSNCWKITAPLRGVGRAYKRVFSRERNTP